MTVAVVVIVPVAVIALVNGNDIVNLIDAVNDSAPGASGRLAPCRAAGRGSNETGCKRATTASATLTASFPFTSAATITGTDHAHDHVHVHDHVAGIERPL